ncbi:hypothetical protein MNBD_NITROSPINAE04-2701 [hydrothermal vent metagenome]|uniref:Dolichol-P-glucose synthetase n=1 Tax=hydrothermal vent metagenome TaxID=652676 RepID=A0A3B1C6J3_9ZZZZ
MKSTGHNLAIWIGWAISVSFIVWAVLKMDLTKVWGALVMADYRWVIPAAILNIALLCGRGARWRHFIAPIKQVSFMSSFSAMCIGFMANMVLPARIGEFVRAYVLAKKESISKSSAFATVVIERAFDGLSVVVMMALIFIFVEPPDANDIFWTSLKIAGITASIFFMIFFTGLYLFHRRVKFMERAVEWLTAALPGKYRAKAREIIEAFRKGFDSIDHGHRVVKIILWCAFIWGAAAPFNYFIFQAFDLDLPISASFLVLLSQILGVMVPSAPGFIGVFHAATIAGLMFYGVDSELALSVALVLHIIMFIMQTIPGLIFLWMEQYSLRDIKHAVDDEEG